MNINDMIDVKIIDVDNKGNGIARYEGFVIIVPNALKDENVRVKLISIKKSYANAIIVTVNKESKMRIDSICPYYNKCGGCSFLHTTYANELKIKEDYLKRIFKGFKLNEIISGDSLNYRNKVILHVVDKKLGFYEEKTKDIVNINSCLLLDAKINEVIKMLGDFDLKDVKKIMIRASLTTKEVMIKFDSDVDITSLKSIDSIYIKNKKVYGADYITENIDGIIYTIYPDSFFQINTLMMKNLYNVIKNYAGYENTLLDLYCGTGSIGFYLKDNFKNIYGVEAVKSSIENAKINKRINNISNISFKLGDASIIKDKTFDVIVVDPPRIGLSKAVVSNLLKFTAKKIVYTSCDPNTLKRDIDLLKEKYDVIEITPINMFPRTGHVECVSVLQRKSLGE